MKDSALSFISSVLRSFYCESVKTTAGCTDVLILQLIRPDNVKAAGDRQDITVVYN